MLFSRSKSSQSIQQLSQQQPSHSHSRPERNANTHWGKNGNSSGFHGAALPSTVSRSNWNLEMLAFVEGGKPEYPEKNPRSRDENQQQTQPTYDTETGNRTQATLVGGECSHHCAILAPIALILKENSFQFSGRNYLQIHGTAMAVTFANIFMADIETPDNPKYRKTFSLEMLD